MPNADTHAQAEVSIEVVRSLSAISQPEWDACACPETAEGGAPLDPFTTYRFLDALEQSGSVGDGTGWYPHYIIARIGDQVIGVAPMYLKAHSQGEYIFDHNWAHAYERAGGNYYPKLQVAVPFTPVTGRRLLVRPEFADVARAGLIQGAVQLAANNNLSSLHITFCTEDEIGAMSDMGLMARVSQQYHWHNDGYADFDAFLDSLSSRKRKAIRKERRTAQDFGGTIRALTGDEIKAEYWDYFWTFYQDTGARKWGSPYLSRAFFDILHDTMRDDVLLVLAERDGRPVAGALNMIGRDCVYGRYWGATEHHPCLHFEACYYQAIDYAISNGLARVEAGAQGDHKLARGYLPVQTHSAHWLRDEGFAKAVSTYLDAERAAVDEEIEILTSYGPFKKAQPLDET
ncbi:MAG: GNAT family N-acetyltransferase [Rhodovulum sp.]|nr:GNAT family N-acetyltransferase [Rhodovulum sp.]